MNKYLVLISSIGLFLAVVRNSLSKFFLASHIVCMRPCKTLGMGEWLLKPSYSFATSIDEAKSTCSVLGFDSHFQNSGTILFRYCRIAFIWYCKQCLPLHSSGTKGESMHSSGTEQHSFAHLVLFSSSTDGRLCAHPVPKEEACAIPVLNHNSTLFHY
jgi:hypothetical protein